jgi:hypothetical protein
MKLVRLLPSLVGMATVSAGVIYIEMMQDPTEWSRAFERLAFLWIGAVAVLLPDLFQKDPDKKKRHHRRRKPHEVEDALS